MFLPLIAKSIVGRTASSFETTRGSIPVGKEGTRSTAFFTCNSIKSISLPFSISTLILPLFSLEVEVTLSTPSKPFKLSSILRTIPSSTS